MSRAKFKSSKVTTNKNMLITWRHSRNKDVFFDKRNKDVENSEIIQVYNNHDRSKFVRQCGGTVVVQMTEQPQKESCPKVQPQRN